MPKRCRVIEIRETANDSDRIIEHNKKAARKKGRGLWT
jgi:hypothetical protein